MKKIVISFFIILSTISANASDTASTIFNKYSSSVAYIETKFGMGTGFLVANNVIVTNRHVVFGLNVEKNSWNAPQKIWLNKGKELAAFKYMICSKRVDICILGVDSKYKLKTESNLTSTSVKPGEDVYIIGHPSGIPVPIISTGIISSEINNFPWDDIRGDKATFQGFTSTAAISPGSSGSPVMSKKGEILGIAVGYYKEAQNLNFIISTSEINLLIKNIYDKNNNEFAYLENGFDKELERNTNIMKSALESSKSSSNGSYIPRGSLDETNQSFVTPSKPIIAEQAPSNPSYVNPIAPIEEEKALTYEEKSKLDKEAISDMLKSNISNLRNCYQSELNSSDNPTGIQGRVNLNFTISASGEVIKTAVLSDEINSSFVKDCLSTVVKSIHFSPLNIGKNIDFSQPLNLGIRKI